MHTGVKTVQNMLRPFLTQPKNSKPQEAGAGRSLALRSSPTAVRSESTVNLTEPGIPGRWESAGIVLIVSTEVGRLTHGGDTIP